MVRALALMLLLCSPASAQTARVTFDYEQDNVVLTFSTGQVVRLQMSKYDTRKKIMDYIKSVDTNVPDRLPAEVKALEGKIFDKDGKEQP